MTITSDNLWTTSKDILFAVYSSIFLIIGFLYGNFGQIRSVRLCSPAAIDGMQMRGITDVPGAYPIHKKVIIELVKIFFYKFYSLIFNV